MGGTDKAQQVLYGYAREIMKSAHRQKGWKMKRRIIAYLVIIGAVCAISGCRSEQDRRNEELMEAYLEEIKAYLEEKYGREFCVDSKRRGGSGSPIPFASEDYRSW